MAFMVSAEVVLWGVVKYHRKKFQWLICPEDKLPVFDETLIKKYFENSFDPELGWLRRPNDQGTDETLGGRTTFTLDDNARRTNPGFEALDSDIAVFGDSFAFCRMVEDDQTWPHYMSTISGKAVQNFGAGNYGVDQAILAFVPDTMARIHAYWKHYFEYGNILAFKPRFTLRDGALELHQPAIRSPENYRDLKAALPEIQKLDQFYRSKFLRDIIKFPYLLSIARRPARHAPILWHLTWGTIRARWYEGYLKAVAIVLRENARVNTRLYRDPQAQELLRTLILRFRDRCIAADITPFFLILPQPADMERDQSGKTYYEDFFSAMKEHVDLLDMTDQIAAWQEDKDVFVHGPLGPHINPTGNMLIAKHLLNHLTVSRHDVATA